ncbi:MAG: insulinase family protein, partial [Verrucomicrobiota bacterium]|nr:insulinase family protein [Verrucomicrobiota bacterium]
RDYLIGQLELSLENTESQMNWVSEQLLGFDRIIPPDEIKACLREIRPSDIRRVAHDFFRPERLCLSLVSPLKNDRGLRKLLEL